MYFCSCVCVCVYVCVRVCVCLCVFVLESNLHKWFHLSHSLKHGYLSISQKDFQSIHTQTILLVCVCLYIYIYIYIYICNFKISNFTDMCIYINTHAVLKSVYINIRRICTILMLHQRLINYALHLGCP